MIPIFNIDEPKLLEILIAKTIYTENIETLDKNLNISSYLINQYIYANCTNFVNLNLFVINSDWNNISLHIANQYIFDNYLKFINLELFSSNPNSGNLFKKYFDLFDNIIYLRNKYFISDKITKEKYWRKKLKHIVKKKK